VFLSKQSQGQIQRAAMAAQDEGLCTTDYSNFLIPGKLKNTDDIPSVD